MARAEDAASRSLGELDGVELLISGDDSLPLAVAREAVSRVAERLEAVRSMLRDYMVRTTCVSEADWPPNIPNEFRSFVAVPNAERYWSLVSLEFPPEASGSYRAYLTFEDEHFEMIYVLWIVEMRNDVPVSLRWESS